MSDRIIEALASVLEDTDYDWSHEPGVKTGKDCYRAKTAAVLAALRADGIAVVDLPSASSTTAGTTSFRAGPYDMYGVYPQRNNQVAVFGKILTAMTARQLAAALIASADYAERSE